MIISTEFGNFRTPEDLYKYMTNEDISECVVNCNYWGIELNQSKMSIQDVKKWVDMGQA